jgi:pimeloyl-ACP methyl ester carboxylesterase
VASRLAIGEGLTLAYEDSGGDGAGVVFVHGLGGSLYTWRAQAIAAAARGYRAIAYDQRGAGLSSKPKDPLSVELWAHDLERLVEGLGLERVALVGHSVGTMVAEQAALRLGARCWALVLLGGRLAWPPGTDVVFAERAHLAREGHLDEVAEAVAAGGISGARRERDPAFAALFAALIAGGDAEGYATAATATAAGSMLTPERVTCPTLALCGEHDAVTPLQASEEIAAAIPGAELALVPEAAHWCQLEAPQAVGELILGFLDRHSPA